MRKSYDAIYADYSAELDETAYYREKIHYADVDGGVIFVNGFHPTFARFIPGVSVLTASPGKAIKTDDLRRIWDHALNNGKLAKKTDRAQLACREVLYKFETEDGTQCWIKNKLLKLFPSWASFYVQGRLLPVLVADPKPDGLHVFGLVMPYNFK